MALLWCGRAHHVWGVLCHKCSICRLRAEVIVLQVTQGWCHSYSKKIQKPELLIQVFDNLHSHQQQRRISQHVEFIQFTVHSGQKFPSNAEKVHLIKYSFQEKRKIGHQIVNEQK